MRISTFRIKQVLAAGLFFCSLSAHAQYSATVEQDPTTNYSSVLASFKLTDVAATLGTDTATLANALQNWSDNAPSDAASKMFVVLNSDGTTNGNYTGNYGEFWLTYNGVPAAYGSGSWYAGNSWNANTDRYSIYVGQFPDSLNNGGTVHANFALVYGQKMATFDITYNVLKLPDAPAAETQISKLNIVGESATEVTQYPRSGYDTDPLYVNIGDAAEKLGTDKKTLSRLMAKLTYQPKINETYGMMTDSLILASTNDGWSRRAMSESGDTLNACGNAPYSKEDAFYIQGFAYDADNDTLTASIGQYPGALKAGQSLYTDIYLVYGSNAYKVRYTLNIIEAEYHGLEDMTQVGDTIINVEQELNTSYTTSAIKPDVNAIAAALGTTSTNLSLQAIDSNGSLSSNSTANNGGYWLTKGGIITGWGTGAAFFVEPTATNNYTQLNIGQYPAGLADGDTARTVLYFVSGANYYSLHINLIIKKGTVIDTELFENVATKSAVIQQLVDNSYTWSDTNGTGTTYAIPLDQINALIGTTDPVFYALEQDTAVAKGSAKYTKRWTCTPYPGFWVSANGQNFGWSSATNSPWGIGYTTSGNNGIIRCLQFPNSSTVGTTYKGQFFLVNEETKKMITINLTYQIVASLETVETVGTTSITVPISFNDSETTLDLAPIAKALGVADANTLLTSGYYLKGLQENGLYSEGVDAINAGLMFDRQGYCNNQGGVFGFTFSDAKTLLSYSNEEIDPGFKVNSTICFQVASKRYEVNITFMNADDYATGVNAVEMNAAQTGKIYDLSGREVSKPNKGVYIRNGKKFIVR